MFSPEYLEDRAGIRFYNFSKSNPRSFCWNRYIEKFDSKELATSLSDGKMPEHEIRTSIVTTFGPLFCTFSSMGGYLVIRVSTIESVACVIMISEDDLIILPKNYVDISSEICNDIKRGLDDRNIKSSIAWY